MPASPVPVWTIRPFTVLCVACESDVCINDSYMVIRPRQEGSVWFCVDCSLKKGLHPDEAESM